MKANNTLNVSDLANWVNFQLSTIIEGISAGYTLGYNSSAWIDRGAKVFTISLATGEEIEVNSDDYNTAEDIAKAIISVFNKNNPSTPDTMNTETKTMKETNETLDRLKSELQEYYNNASKGGADRERTMQWLQEDIKKMEQKNEVAAIITVSITEDGNKCEYTHNGKMLAFIAYRKEFDKYDVNTPSVGYMTDNVAEAHKACESGVNHLLNTSAVFDYSEVERYNAVNYPETICPAK